MTHSSPSERVRRLARPWGERLGIEQVSIPNSIFFVRADVSTVADCLAQGATLHVKRALGHSVPVHRPHQLIYRLEGHPWSVVLQDHEPRQSWEAAVAARLLDPTMPWEQVAHYQVHPNPLTLGLRCFRNGKLERQWPPGEPESTQEHIDVALRDLGIYEPGIEARYFMGFLRPPIGDQVRLENPGFSIELGPGATIQSVPQIERVDYVVP